MRKTFTLWLALVLALFLGSVGTSSATEATGKAHLIIVGDNPDVTTISTTVAQVATYLDADQNVRLNDGGGGTWAQGTADEVEWCWTDPAGITDNVELSRDFRIILAYSISSTGTSASTWATVGVDSTSGLAAGDEVGFIPVSHLIVAADVTNATVVEYATVTSGGCVGILVDSADSGDDITIHHFTLDIEQVVTTR